MPDTEIESTIKIAGFSMNKNIVALAVVMLLGGGATGTLGSQIFGFDASQIDSIEEQVTGNSTRIGAMETHLEQQEKSSEKIVDKLDENTEQLNQIIGFMKREYGF